MNVIFAKEMDATLCNDFAKAQDELSNFKNMLNKVLEGKIPSAETLNGYNSKLNELQLAYNSKAQECRQNVPKELYFNSKGIKYQWYTSSAYSLFCIEVADYDKLLPETKAWVDNLMTENGMTLMG